MQTKPYLYWSAQIGGWLTYGILIFLATFDETLKNETLNEAVKEHHLKEMDINIFLSLFLFLILGVIITHFMRLLYIKWGILNMKLTMLIPRIILFSMSGAIIMAICNHLNSVYIEKAHDKSLISLNFLVEILSISILLILWNAIYFIYHFFKKTMTQELNVVQMQANQNEIELKSLRSQINPHFLFNSLNSIRALIDIEPKLAKESVTSLSNLLRKSLVQGKHAFISLADEIDLVKNYLDLEKIRFEERLKVIWNINSSLEAYQIPPFLIHTQVENAIKHGISKLIDGGIIEITIERQDDRKVKFEIKNTGKIEPSTSETGIGIENTMRRLDLQYKGKASFQLKESDGFVICTIIIEEKN